MAAGLPSQQMPQGQWVSSPTPYNPADPSNSCYFASRIMAGRPLPTPPASDPLDSVYPSFGRALSLSHRLGVRPSTETLKNLEIVVAARILTIFNELTTLPRLQRR